MSGWRAAAASSSAVPADTRTRRGGATRGCTRYGGAPTSGGGARGRKTPAEIDLRLRRAVELALPPAAPDNVSIIDNGIIDNGIIDNSEELAAAGDTLLAQLGALY